MDIESIERFVMERLLDGDHPILESLRNQYKKVKIKRKELTETGFFINYSYPTDIIKIEPSKSFQFGDVIGHMKEVKDGVGFLLFVKDGIIDFLEGYTYGDEKWPDTITDFHLSYDSGDNRDIEKLKEKFSKIV